MGGRRSVGFKSRLKFGLFLRSYIYSERGNFAASFYDLNSILMFFPKQTIFRGGALIISDQGSHFRNQLMYNMRLLIGYNHIFSTPYHPQTNGIVRLRKRKIRADFFSHFLYIVRCISTS